MSYESERVFREAIRFLNEKYDCTYVRVNLNKGRHVMLRPINLDNNRSIPTFYLVFKREVYKTFKDEFKEFCEHFSHLGDVGESINKEAVEYAVRRNVTYFGFVYPTNALYIMDVREFRDFAYKYNLIRKQDKTNLYEKEHKEGLRGVQEVTYSTPIKNLRRLK